MAKQTSVGYSGTPLAAKLGIKADSCVLLVDAPKDYHRLLGPLPAGVKFVNVPGRQVTVAQAFVTRRQDLDKLRRGMRKELAVESSLWISWPKKSAKVATDVSENTVTELALPFGFVDVKVCAVTEVWSGLKLVVRKSRRS